MVEPFKEEEIYSAVWACGNDKSPGPDGLNFKFIKHFLNELKPEFLRFLAEFHGMLLFLRASILHSLLLSLSSGILNILVILDLYPS